MRILVIQITTILLIIGLCSSNVSSDTPSIEADNARKNESVADSPRLDKVDFIPKKNDSKEEEEEEEEEEGEEGEDQSKEELPILPPIILLDFGNNTEEENATLEEKTKRTVNSGLGYGLESNAIQMRKYNYYFPAGKSGTTVSIEESISPFLPKTIIERVQPNNQKGRFGAHQNSFASFYDISSQNQNQNQNQPDPRYLNLQQATNSQSVFGLRMKPQKTAASSSSDSYQKFFATSKPPVGSFAIQNSGYRNNDVPTTTQSPLAFSATETVRYVTSGSANFANPQSGSLNYVTAAPFRHNGNAQAYTGQRQNIQSNINSHGFGSVPQSVDSSTTSPPLNHNSHFPTAGSQFSNGPTYTLESGLRQENKVFWKYPDGRVSDVPPSTYVETYSEYPQSLTQQPAKSQSPHSIYETSSTENSILSQGPVQFPTVSEQTGREPNPFVSAESLSSSLPQQQVYRLGYQNLVTQRQNVNLAQQRKPVATSYSFSSVSPPFSEKTRSPEISYESRYRQTPSRYMVNNPNPEYTNGYPSESAINSTTPLNPFFGSSTVNPSRTTSKYNSKVQSYLDTVLSRGEGSKKHGFTNNDLSSYSNLRYSDLLNYNPSISEYIRNPSSILNVRPTFVQAGSSLIPVIILRVDGVSPVQAKDTQNINLKALLQEYLVQYAKSIQELAQPSTYDLGPEPFSKRLTSGPSKSPVLDLIRLTQDDAREAPGYSSDPYVGRSSYETSNLKDSKDFANSYYVERSNGRQKVKNVEILDDPRYTPYKINN